MTLTTTELLLEATGIRKAYGAVLALKNASLAVRPGEVHALMGANGAGKSTLVKILTGAVRPDAGTLSVRGREFDRPFAGRGAPRRHRVGLPGTGVDPGPGHPGQSPSHRDADRALPPLARTNSAWKTWTCRAWRGSVPLASLRVIDLARAMAIEPDVLMLDEMTAALPANLTERVLEVIGRQRGGDRSVIFISHRMIEIAAVCDRATVLREGETVGVVDVTEGSEERIVELMLGHIVEDMAGGRRASAGRGSVGRREAPHLRAKPRRAAQAAGCLVRPLPGRGARRGRARGPGAGRAVRHPRGLRTPDGRRAARRRLARLVPPSRGRHPGGPRLRAGRPGGGAADAALGAREHRAAVDRPGQPLGPDRHRRRAHARSTTASSGCRSTRARRARSAGCRAATSRRSRSRAGSPAGVRTMLCFDPTRGIDIRTKQQIYVLLRDLAEAGRRRPALHLGAEGDPARLRPGDRHLRRPGGRRDRRRRCRRAGAAAGRLQPSLGRPDAGGGRGRGRRGGRRRGSRAGRSRRLRRTRPADAAPDRAGLPGGDR